MSNYNITDITVAGAICNAIATARESDRRAAGCRPSDFIDATIRTPATIWNILVSALRHTGQTCRTEVV
jgi:hypothetical protein